MSERSPSVENATEEEMATTSNKLQTFIEYREMTDMDEIGRRKFANNAFDGVLFIGHPHADSGGSFVSR